MAKVRTNFTRDELSEMTTTELIRHLEAITARLGELRSNEEAMR